MSLPFEVIDSHIHFFLSSPIAHPEKWSSRLTEDVLIQMRKRFELNLRERGQPEMDTSLKTPDDYASRWIREFEFHGIHSGIFLSLEEDLAPLKEFTSHRPDRFIPYGFVDPLDPQAAVKLEQQVKNFGVRGLKLIPTNQWFHPYDEAAYPLYDRAQDLGIPLLIHCGVSIGYNADFRYANPLDLQPVLRDFPGLTIILAHFGAGFFREALLLCYQCSNIFLDTSSSNIWMNYQDHSMNITDVFRRALNAAGAGRIIFGTDSSYFPRGFRKEIFDQQYRALLEIGCSSEDMNLIFSGNIRRILGL